MSLFLKLCHDIRSALTDHVIAVCSRLSGLVVRTYFKSFFYLLDFISQLSYLREDHEKMTWMLTKSLSETRSVIFLPTLLETGTLSIVLQL